MKNKTKLRKSRDNWSRKAKARNTENRRLRKKLERRDARIKRQEEKIERQDKKIAELKSARSSPSLQGFPVGEPIASQEVRVICVMVVLFSVVSFRSVPRILAIFSLWLPELKWQPHFTSVINWTMRVGLAKLKAVSSTSTPWVAMIDISIDEGTKKALTILRVPLDIMKKGRAVCLSDCLCVGVIVSESWNGELVSKALKSVFERSGVPRAILLDGGRDLNKGVRLWKEQTGNGQVLILQDLGHWIANGLKQAFSKLKSFSKFVSSVSSAGKKLSQSNLSFLRPPKIRTKGRFQNLSHIAKWAKKIIDILDSREPPLELSDIKKIKKILPRFSQFKPFLKSFVKSIDVSSEIQKILKSKGLNRATYLECMKLVEHLPKRSKLKKKIIIWLRKHLSIQCRLGIGQTPIPVSTDPLESLFGKFKVIIARNPKAQFNRIVLAMPALCGEVSIESLQENLNQISHLDLQEWEKGNIKSSNCRKRKQLNWTLARSKNCPSLAA